MIENIRRLSTPDADYEAYRASLIHPGTQMPVIDRIRLENNSRFTDAYIRSHVVDTQTGKPLDPQALQRELGKVYGLEVFQNVRYEVNKDGKKNDTQNNNRGSQYYFEDFHEGKLMIG